MSANPLPSYRDARLGVSIKELREATKHDPVATRALKQVEHEFKRVLRPVEIADETHARRAEELLALGLFDAASTHVTLLSDTDLQNTLYRRVHAMRGPLVDVAAEHVAEAIDKEREVLE